MPKLILPYPPSINHYYGHRPHAKGKKFYVKEQGRRYKMHVRGILQHMMGYTIRKPKRALIAYCAHPPDRRRRDIDNLNKCLLDSLKHHVYEDDSQVCILQKGWGEPLEIPRIDMWVSDTPDVLAHEMDMLVEDVFNFTLQYIKTLTRKRGIQA